MNAQLKKELYDTMFLHEPLPAHREKSLYEECLKKKILNRKTIWDGTGASCQPEICPQAELRTEQGEHILHLTAPLRADHWPEYAEADGNYSNFGSAELSFRMQEEDWSGYNRLHFQVRPVIKGARTLTMNAAVRSEGTVPVPDAYRREGDTMFTLENRVWNDCIWEFDAMPRDCVTGMKLYVNLTGQDTCMDDHLTYEFRDIYLEQAEKPEKEKGWDCPEGRIVFSTVGYFTYGKKTAVFSDPGVKTFTLVKAANYREVFSGEIQKLTNEKGTFGILDFSQVTEEGSFYLQAGDVTSETFIIGKDVLEEPVWKALNFIFCERCGTPVSGKHQACHLDMIAEHNGLQLSFAGGWHDAGDVSQQAEQTGEVVHALCELAAGLPEDDMLRKRLLEEAQWGIDYILRTRFGDGYRATSAAATRITNGLAGDMDDIAVRVHNNSFDNFMFAGILAYASHVFARVDQELAYGCLKAAQEDFAFAEEEFEQSRVHLTEMFEHTYNSGMSQYYAVMSYAASCIYLAGKEEKYALLAVKWADKLLKCQETGSAAGGWKGFFYREENHEEIVHFNHQSREHQFMQALTLLCRTQPEHPDRSKWERAMKLYGIYLKELMSYAEPYRMIPAGIHRMDEAEKKETFRYLHLTVDYETEKENYEAQLKAGVKIDENHVIRQFPVWFSFRGNNAVLLSQAKAASLLGRYFEDEELLQIGRDQMYFIWGKNPFAQSMQYGAGSRFCGQYMGFLGETPGAIPVGMETLNNGDEPYWPMNINATYKEVWMSSVGRFLQLAADYAQEGIKKF